MRRLIPLALILAIGLMFGCGREESSPTKVKTERTLPPPPKSK